MNLSCKARVDCRLLLLRMATVIPALRLHVRDAARRGDAIFADHHGHIAVMRNELAKVAEVVTRSLGRPGPPVARIDVEKIGIVGIRVIGGEYSGCKRRCRFHPHGVESNRIVVVLLGLLRWPLFAGAEERQFLLLRRLGGMRERVERGPVGVGDGPLRVVALHLVPGEVVALLGEPCFNRVSLRQGDVRSAIAGAVRTQRVVRDHRIRLPFPADDVPEGPRRYVCGVQAARAPWRRLDGCIAMEQAHDALHLVAELRRPLRVVVPLLPLTGRQFRPHSVDQPDRFLRMGKVPRSQRGVEVRRVNGVHAYRVRIHLRHHRKPTVVGAIVRRELGGVFAWQGRPEIDGLDPQRLPTARRVAHLEHATSSAGDEIRYGGACARGQRRLQDRGRNARKVGASRGVAWHNAQGALEVASRGPRITSACCGHPRAGDRVVRGGVELHRPGE